MHDDHYFFAKVKLNFKIVVVNTRVLATPKFYTNFGRFHDSVAAPLPRIFLVERDLTDPEWLTMIPLLLFLLLRARRR